MPHDNARMGEEGRRKEEAENSSSTTTNDCGVCLASFAGGEPKLSALMELSRRSWHELCACCPSLMTSLRTFLELGWPVAALLGVLW